MILYYIYIYYIYIFTTNEMRPDHVQRGVYIREGGREGEREREGGERERENLLGE
jgi:hypothetical protein